MKDQQTKFDEAQKLAEETAAAEAAAAAAKEQELKDAAVDDDVSEDDSKYTIIPDMKLSRKVTTKGGKSYADYYVHGVLRGVPVKVRVKPGKDGEGWTDVSAYTLLNIVFGEKDEAQFAVRAFKRRDSATNRVTSSLTHYAYVKDGDDGEEYTAPLRFETAPDKAIISKLIEVANKAHSLGLSV